LKIVVDKQITGWKDLGEGELLKKYDEILKVGVHYDLPQRMDDKAIASYCTKNNCPLITADIKAYANFFQKGSETVQIRLYGFDKKADRQVFIVRMLDGPESMDSNDSF
jgi:hypothetical protein